LNGGESVALHGIVGGGEERLTVARLWLVDDVHVSRAVDDVGVGSDVEF